MVLDQDSLTVKEFRLVFAKELIQTNAISTSHVWEYRGKGGFLRKIPFIKLQTKAELPKRGLDTLCKIEDTADRTVFTELYSKPKECKCAKKFTKSIRDGLRGLICC